MALVKNTTESGKGFTVDGRDYKFPAGETLEVPDDSLAKARKEHVLDGLFVDGTFVVVTAEQQSSVEVAEAKRIADEKSAVDDEAARVERERAAAERQAMGQTRKTVIK
jgi:hypothetical protein